MRWILTVALATNLCCFKPALDGTSLVDCSSDTDCPRGGKCIERICIAQPLTVVRLTVTPPSVEAGGTCRFEAEAVHSLKPSKISYAWKQVAGPAVSLQGTDSPTTAVTTLDDLVTAYTLELTVSNPRGEQATARATCTAILFEDAAFVVEGEAGMDCTPDDPCGTINSVSDQTRIYFGRRFDAPYPPVYNFDLDSTFDGRELHAGYWFPGWTRDAEATRVALSTSSDSLEIDCNDCLLTGLYETLVVPVSSSWPEVIDIDGTNVTVRDATAIATGGELGTHATIVEAGQGTILERVVARVGPEGLQANTLIGVYATSETSRIVDLTVDLIAATANTKEGLVVDGSDSSYLGTGPTIDRAVIKTGGAIGNVTGFWALCAAPIVSNIIVDARGPAGDSSTGLAIAKDYTDTSCPNGATFHSSLFIAGEGKLSIGLLFDNQAPSSSIINCIIDAGQGGWERRGIHLDSSALSSSNVYDLEGSVLIFEGGLGARDMVARSESGEALTLAEVETELGCPGCLDQADTAAHVDKDNGNFHLTAESTCCAGRGRPLTGSDPTNDLDGTLRPQPPAQPAVGPYEYIP